MPSISFSPRITQVDYPGSKSFPDVASYYISLVNEKREGKRKRRTLTPPVWTENNDVTLDLYVYLWSVGFRILNDMHEAHVLTEKPSVDTMATVLLDHALSFTDGLMDSPDYSRKANRLRSTDPERIARNAASKVAREWNWDYVGKRVRAGRVTASKRRYERSTTLDDLATVQHIKSKQGQAEALGCSTATIARLRREWNEREAEIEIQRQVVEVDKMLAEFLAEPEPEAQTFEQQMRQSWADDLFSVLDVHDREYAKHEAHRAKTEALSRTLWLPTVNDLLD